MKAFFRNAFHWSKDRTKMTKEEQDKFIPAEFIMISGCHDGQVSHCLNSTSQFDIPLAAKTNSSKVPGSACTSALLEVGYKYHNRKTNDNFSWLEFLTDVRTTFLKRTQKAGLMEKQVPQLSSSRMMDPAQKSRFLRRTKKGKQYAILIGINYDESDGKVTQLTGSHQDVANMKKYLMDVHKMKEANMNILVDDDNNMHLSPTKANIELSLKEAVAKLKKGDSLFFLFSGHGGQVKDTDGDEEDEFDEVIYPVDHKTNGVIVDDDLLKNFVQKLKKGVFVTCLIDSCHSGTVLDLPYILELE